MNLPPDSARHVHGSDAPGTARDWPLDKLRRHRSPWVLALLPAIIVAVVTGGVGILVALSSGMAAFPDGLLVAALPTVAVGTLVAVAAHRWLQAPARTAKSTPNSSIHQTPADDVLLPSGRPGVVDRRAFFTRLTDIPHDESAANCVIVIDVNRPNVLTEDADDVIDATHSEAVARMVVDAVGDADAIVGRLSRGGFGVVLLDRTPDQGERLCRRIRDEAVRSDTPMPSFGLTDWRPADEGIDQALGRADGALYRAKQRGGNRTEVVRRDEDGRGATSDLAPVARR